MLQIRNISKDYYISNRNTVHALKNVSIDFPEKGLVFIVGKSGSGKSTLLNILGGLDSMTSGEIMIDGYSTDKFSRSDFDAFRNFHIGFIFQEFNLIEDITVYDNIALALKIQTKNHDISTVGEVLKMVGLEGLGYRKPNEMSGGQRQRVSIARALVKNPKIILADEPTGALDSKTGEDLIASLKIISESRLVIIVSHDMELAHTYGDRIIAISDGEIINNLEVDEAYYTKGINNLCPQVIKINSGSTLSETDAINEVLKKDTVNFLCLNSDKEKIVLAYPETLEELYENKSKKTKFVMKNNKALLALNPNFAKKTQKAAKIKINECLKMAFKSFKAKRKRFIILLFFMIATISCFGITLQTSNVTTPKIIANTTKGNHLPFIQTKKIESTKDFQTFYKPFTEELIKETEKKHKRATAPCYNMNLTYQYKRFIAADNFGMNATFNGIVEKNSLQSLGLKKVAGDINFSTSDSLTKKIVISDYAAFEMCRTGYFGYDKSGALAVLSPNTINEVINTKIFIGTTAYEIKGVFKTEYKKYLSLIDNGGIDSMINPSSSAALAKLKSMYYCKIFAPEGFMKNFSSYNGMYNVSFNYHDLRYGSGISQGSYPSTIDSQFIYRYDKKELLKVSPLSTGLPEKLNDNEIIIIMHNGYDIAQVDANKKTTLSVSDIVFYENVLLKMLIPSYSMKTIVYASDSIFSAFEDAKWQSSTALINASGSNFQLEMALTKLAKNNYEVDVSFREVGQIANVFNQYLVPLSLGFAAFFGIFSFLIILSFISSSVKARRKEIGILRATGARSMDVFKIFFTEIFLLSIFTTAIAVLLVNWVTRFINSSFSTIIQNASALSFGIFQIIILALISLGFVFISAIIPLLRIVMHQPVDAIRRTN